MESNLVWGITLLIVGIGYLYFLFKERSFDNVDLFQKFLFIKDYLSGILLILFGVSFLLTHFKIWKGNDLINGITFILLGIIFLSSVFKNYFLKEGNTWDKSMFFRGIVGGIAFIAIGITYVLKHYN